MNCRDHVVQIKQSGLLPRLPLEGTIDLTYRCTNRCCHCWLRESHASKPELTFKEITDIVAQARQMGCRNWVLSGGEPLLRVDFPELFAFITGRCATYTLNTNGTLITPAIAKILKRKGNTIISLYGANALVHDRITRTPGSFKQTMRGFRCLKEAGVDFIVQLMVMKDNYHSVNEMVRLAKSLSKQYKFGPSWLYFSASGNQHTNAGILRQRLSPSEVIKIDQPCIDAEERIEADMCYRRARRKYLFSSCIKERNGFHIDPFGGMSFCHFIKDPALRYDLRAGSFRECWEKFIPSLATKIRATGEYRKDCDGCEASSECRWCPVYGYLEHRRFPAKVEYLCRIAREQKKFKREWLMTHRRYFAIGGLTLQVDSDLPFSEKTFHPKFKEFEAAAPGNDVISIAHHFSIPSLKEKDLGEQVYRKTPWTVYKKGDSWLYVTLIPGRKHDVNKVVECNADHTRMNIYHQDDKAFRMGGAGTLSLLATDQILLARVMPEKQGFYLHSCGVSFNGKGLLFAGVSGAGKSTVAGLLKGEAEILCDDRMIVRRLPAGFTVFGTWSHGTVPIVSGKSAPLAAVVFLEQSSSETRLLPILNKRDRVRALLPHLILPLVTANWWEKNLVLIDRLVNEIPCYILRFERDSRSVGNVLRAL